MRSPFAQVVERLNPRSGDQSGASLHPLHITRSVLHTLIQSFTRQRIPVNHDNVIPFRKPPPSEAEMEAYQLLTRNWDPSLRRLMFPEHFKHEQDKAGRG
jgi:hypothetical protein